MAAPLVIAAAIGAGALFLLRGGKSAAKGAELDAHPDKSDIAEPVLPGSGPNDGTPQGGGTSDDAGGAAASSAATAPATSSAAAKKAAAAKKKPAPVVLAPAQLAKSAVNTVRGFIVQHAGKPPQVAIEQVRTFQASVRLVHGSKITGLKQDGLWGPVTRAAAAEALGVAEATLPPYASAYAPKSPPAAPIKLAPAKATPAKPPLKLVVKPAAAKPTTLPKPPAKKAAAPVAKLVPTPPAKSPAISDLASAAANAVRGFIVANGGKPPQIAISQVRQYQTALASSAVKVDGIWGPVTRAATAKTLKVSESTLPPYASAYGKPAATALAFPARTPAQAARDLLAYLTKINTVASTWGTKAKPNETVRRAQADMGQLVADGIYGPKTQARGSALAGQKLPVRP